MKKDKTGQRHAAGGGRARAIDLKALDTRGKRFLEVVPQTYDANEHTIELTLSEGSAVQRWYGIERLSTDEAAVCIDRLGSSGIPFLDSHNQWGLGAVLGRIVDVWFAEGRILGRAKFAANEAGKAAEGMVARGEISGISIGYRVDAWEVADADGNVIDPEKQILDVDDGLTFTATRWELLEVSLVSVPADPAAMVRSHDQAGAPDPRASPLAKGAREITVANGDASVTYRYGATASAERAAPAPSPAPLGAAGRAVPDNPNPKTQTRKSPMRKNVRADDQGAPKDKDTTEDARAKRGKREGEPRTDEDGNLVDEDGHYVDENGEPCDEPVKARAEPMVDDDGYYVDDEGNWVDADGAPSDDPVKARADDADDEGEDDRKARGARGARGTSGRAERGGAQALSRSHVAELVRIGDQARGLNIKIDIADAIERGLKPDALRKRMFDELAQRSKQKGPGSNVSSVQVIRDERQGRAGAMELALVRNMLAARGSDGIDYEPKRREEKRWVEKHDAQSEQYRSLGFVEIAAECLGHRGNIRNARQALDIVERAFQSTSDFPAIFQNVLNKSLLARYELAEPTYKELAVERPFNDFRPHPQVRTGEFPTLQPVTETGELKSGASFDSGENVSIKPYGVIFPISRQMIVNDQLGAIDQILGSAGDQVRVFENTTFFAMFNANPVLMQDGTAVWHAKHTNLAASGVVPSVTSIGAGRAALRAMRSLSGLLINVPPRMIVTGPQLETVADQLVATIAPQISTSVNPFSGKLKSVSDANITDTSWYLMADPARVPCFVYGFLNGANGPRVRTYEPFGVQGVQVSLEHDFGCGAIDYRGAYRNPGALPAN